MASRMSRRSCLRGRPPGLTGGNIGSSSLHWASVRSEGERWRGMHTSRWKNGYAGPLSPVYPLFKHPLVLQRHIGGIVTEAPFPVTATGRGLALATPPGPVPPQVTLLGVEEQDHQQPTHLRD